MTLCSIVSAVQAVRTAVAAMRARCGVPAGTALEPVNTATLAGDGGGRGLLADIFWKTAAAVETLTLLETVARPITPGEQVCHANPWIDQVRAWIDGIMPAAEILTLVCSGFTGSLSGMNGRRLIISREYGNAEQIDQGDDLRYALLQWYDDGQLYPDQAAFWQLGFYWYGPMYKAIQPYDRQGDSMSAVGIYTYVDFWRGWKAIAPSNEWENATVEILTGDQT